jgi:hypothetical protein
VSERAKIINALDCSASVIGNVSILLSMK